MVLTHLIDCNVLNQVSSVHPRNMFNFPISFAGHASGTQDAQVDTSNDGDNLTVTPMRPFTRSRAFQVSSPGNTTFQPGNGHGLPNFGSMPYARNIPGQPKRSQRKRRHAPFTILTDQDSAPTPAPKKSKTNLRTPLGQKNDSANSTPSASPRPSDEPFRFSLQDPLWTDSENYNNRRTRRTVPTEVAAPVPVPEVAPAAPPAPRLVLVARLPVARWFLVEPKNMEAYALLGLKDWRVGSKAVTAAYRQEALKCHPDKASGEAKGAATKKMQWLNAAREILTDNKRRYHYHLTGTLPWSG